MVFHAQSNAAENTAAVITTAIGHAAEEMQMQDLCPEDDGAKVTDYIKNLQIRAGPVMVIFVGHFEPLCKIAAGFSTEAKVFTEADFPLCGGQFITKKDKDKGAFTQPALYEFTPDSEKE